MLLLRYKFSFLNDYQSYPDSRFNHLHLRICASGEFTFLIDKILDNILVGISLIFQARIWWFLSHLFWSLLSTHEETFFGVLIGETSSRVLGQPSVRYQVFRSSLSKEHHSLTYYVFISTSHISAKNGGSFLFFNLREKHISEFWLPSVLSSVKTERSLAKTVPGFGCLRLSTYALRASRYISWIFSTFQPSISAGRSAKENIILM